MKGPKAEKMESLFDSIATDYDKLNHILSFDIDKTWRRRAIKAALGGKNPGSKDGGAPSGQTAPLRILDLACGTGDFSIALAKNAAPGTTVTGLDLSEGMLKVMEEKVAAAGLSGSISARQGNCEEMPFADGEFDVVSISFGIRNFENREAALREILRVLRPGGRLVILELSTPTIPLVRGLYKFYLTQVLTRIGGRVSGDKPAYRYLSASILKFPGKEEWMETMRGCGYSSVAHKSFTLGACRMYTAEK